MTKGLIDAAPLKERLIAKLKNGGTFVLRSCSMCNYPLSYHSDGARLYYNAGCECSWGGSTARDWSELDFYLDPAHGHIANIEAWLAA